MRKLTESDNNNNLLWMFRAFKYRNYRQYFTGQGISLIGLWVQNVAVQWLVYRMTNSPHILGTVSFITLAPTLIFTPFAGVFADKYSKKNILVITQILSAIQAFVFSYLVFSGKITIPQIMILGGIIGIVSAIDTPVRHSFLVDIIEKKEDFVNAIAMNSALFNSARLIGPPIAGYLIEKAGEGNCFLINGLSYIAVIFSLIIIKPKTQHVQKTKKKVLHDLAEGFKYSLEHKPIKHILINMTLVSLAGMPYLLLTPILAKDILHGTSKTYGFLLSGVGIGALCGSVYMASRKSDARLWRVIVHGTAVFIAGMIACAISKNIMLSFFMMMLCGFGVMTFATSSNTLIQTLVDDDKRGRVTGLFVIAFMGTMPIGNYIAGIIAEHIGAPNTLLLCAVMVLISIIFYHFNITKLEPELIAMLNKPNETKPVITDVEDESE